MTGFSSYELFESLSYVNLKYIEETDADRNTAAKPSLTKTARIILIAALLSVLLTGAAYGAGRIFRMTFTENTEPIRQSFDGINVTYNDVGLILRFEGAERCHAVGFRTDYLPSEPTVRCLYPDGEWYRAVCDESDAVPEVGYNIYADQASVKTSLMIGGRARIVKEYSSDELQIVEIISDYTGTEFEHSGVSGASFILVLDTANGCIIRIASNRFGLDELEKILSGMELYIYQETTIPPYTLDYGFINPARG